MNERPVVLWLGGWVSSFACWESLLEELYPEFTHRFVDVHDVLDMAAPPFHSSKEGKGGGVSVVAAWSLGALRAHRWMAAGTWHEDLPLLSLCPVFRFVQPGGRGAFGESILLRMEQKLGSEREAVLRDFWRRMPRAADMPPEWEARWLEASRRYTDDSVLDALRYLRTEVVDLAEPGGLRAVPARWELVAGDADRLAPAQAWQGLLPPGARGHVLPGGHLPFWEHPDVVRGALRRLAGMEAS